MTNCRRQKPDSVGYWRRCRCRLCVWWWSQVTRVQSLQPYFRKKTFSPAENDMDNYFMDGWKFISSSKHPADDSVLGGGGGGGGGGGMFKICCWISEVFPSEKTGTLSLSLWIPPSSNQLSYVMYWQNNARFFATATNCMTTGHENHIKAPGADSTPTLNRTNSFMIWHLLPHIIQVFHHFRHIKRRHIASFIRMDNAN